jgi:DMSO/TMAO reductase YedYZ molybdopterin-dependent catalytic subunit
MQTMNAGRVTDVGVVDLIDRGGEACVAHASTAVTPSTLSHPRQPGASMSSERDTEGEVPAGTHIPGITRRRLLGLGLAGAATGLAHRLSGQAPAAGPPPPPPVQATEPGVVILNARPLDAEAPITALRTLETPLDNFFVRSHHGPPAQIPPKWTLTIDGEVERPVVLSLDEIRAIPAIRRLVTTECSGNGRGRFRLPNTGGVQWGLGAVSSATWTGVPLSTLLERAGPKVTALHFWMEPADRGLVPATPAFLRSIAREDAMRDAFIAYEMNGDPIPLLHGGPLRLIMPGWFGMASTKWLTHVHARPTESDNFFMAKGYRYPDGTPVQRLVVKSLITSPLEGARLSTGRVTITGTAWTGTGTIERVEVSGDGGRSWAPARFASGAQPGAWRLWEAEIDVAAPGEHSVLARATDSEGNVQPTQATANPGGYANNSIHEVRYYATRA